MPKDMLGTAVRKLVTLPGPVLGIVCDLLGKVADPEWVEATKRFLRKENPWPEVGKVMSDLLKFVATVTTKAVDLFKPEEKFREGEQDGVKVAYVSPNFKQVMSGKTETNVPGATLRVHQLRKESADGPIIAERGGEEVVETTFAQMWQMVMAQGRGQRGKLLINGYVNVFYIRDANGVIWAVRCYWFASHDGWHFHAYPITHPHTWNDGALVVSC